MSFRSDPFVRPTREGRGQCASRTPACELAFGTRTPANKNRAEIKSRGRAHENDIETTYCIYSRKIHLIGTSSPDMAYVLVYSVLSIGFWPAGIAPSSASRWGGVVCVRTRFWGIDHQYWVDSQNFWGIALSTSRQGRPNF